MQQFFYECDERVIFFAGLFSHKFPSHGDFYFASAVSKSMRIHVNVVNCVDCFTTVGYSGTDPVAFNVIQPSHHANSRARCTCARG